ncbi:hypothetical protein ACIBQX_49260 [Nonomuraea sp. NPDC049714]|uniref:hypothetical protein n=1 Tax=Nonomuraea sp. NPDC049714 TaxID=3364357 RepID=UPI0037A9E46B
MALALRLIRAAAFAVVCVMVSAGGHTFAGGGALSALSLVVSSVVPFALALVFNGRERACETVLAATAITQVVLHQVFAQIAPAVPAGGGHSHVNVGMALVHLTVALLSGWWLHQGESVVWTMLRLWATAPLRLLFLMAAGPVRAPAGRRPALFAVRSRPWRSREFAAAVRRRGPPMLAHAG